MVTSEDPELEHAASFFVQVLGIPDDTQIVVVGIEDKEDLLFEGVCWNMEQYLLILVVRNETSLTTLAHEMVHALQFAQGRLEYEGDYAYFGGEKYHMESAIEQLFSDSPEDEYPWEQEAYGLQDELVRRYLSQQA